MDNLSGGLLALVITFLFFLAILWFILPFAVFGIKHRLDIVIAGTRATNALLVCIRQDLAERHQTVTVIPPPARERAEFTL